MDRLPLFPLGTALLPGAPLGLQVFEPRYVALLHDLLGEDREGGREGSEAGRRAPLEPVFGVVGIRRGWEVGDAIRDTHDVGCTARITQLGVLGQTPEGSGVFGLLARGERRFHLRGIDEAAGTPYLTGLVEWVEDSVGDPGRAAALADAVAAAVGAHLAAHELELEDPAPTDPSEVSWWAPRAVDLASDETQLLLAAPDTVTRLGLVLKMIQRENALGDQLGTPLGRAVTPPPSSWN